MCVYKYRDACMFSCATTVCIYIYICIYTYAHTHLSVYRDIYVYIHISTYRTHVNTHIYIHIHMYIYRCPYLLIGAVPVPEAPLLDSARPQLHRGLGLPEDAGGPRLGPPPQGSLPGLAEKRGETHMYVHTHVCIYIYRELI